MLVFQNGFGSEAIWGIEATRAINVELPIVIFAFLFGIAAPDDSSRAPR